MATLNVIYQTFTQKKSTNAEFYILIIDHWINLIFSSCSEMQFLPDCDCFLFLYVFSKTNTSSHFWYYHSSSCFLWPSLVWLIVCLLNRCSEVKVKIYPFNCLILFPNLGTTGFCECETFVMISATVAHLIIHVLISLYYFNTIVQNHFKIRCTYKVLH